MRHLVLEERGRPHEHHIGTVGGRAHARRDCRPRRFPTRADQQRSIRRDDIARRSNDGLRFAFFEEAGFAVRPKNQDAGNRRPQEPGDVTRQSGEIDFARRLVKRRRHRREYALDIHSHDGG